MATKNQPVAVKAATVARIDLDNLDEATGDPRIDRCKEIIKEAKVRLVLLQGKGVGAVVVHELLSIGIFELVDEGIDTMCVELKGDGVLRIKVGIEKLLAEGVDYAMWGLTHETRHILMPIFSMKSGGEIGFLSEQYKDPLFKNQALEYWNNNGVMRLFGARKMLDVFDSGEPMGLMDPDKAYQKYREFKKSVSEEPVSRDQFLLTPDVCYGYLKELPAPPKQRHGGFCNHDRGSGAGAPGENGSGVDAEEAEALMDQIFDFMMERALRGDDAAKDDLLDVGQMLGGEGSKFWSDMGLGRLVGKPIAPIKVRFWEAFLLNVLGSILTPGIRMEYPKKMAGADPFYRAVNSGLPLMPLGKEPEKTVSVFMDTSGSIPQELVERFSNLVGQISGCTVKWHTFTTEVVPLEESPTEFKYDRGGTSFIAIDEYLQAQDEIPDCVLIVTDGYAPKIQPSWADNAVWVITEDGDPWPIDYGMECVVTDIPAQDV